MSNPSDFRALVLQRLEENGITIESIADQIGQVIQGKRVRQTYVVDKAGKRTLKEEEIITTPGDLARGAIIFDRLHGGKLGLIPKEATAGKPQEDMVRRFAPAVDYRIISRTQTPSTQTATEVKETSPVEVLVPILPTYQDGDDDPI
jgi:hypothetical protein